MTDETSSILAFAEELADTARKIVQQHLRQGFETEIKGDGSPVTVVDRAVEKALRERIADRFPRHGVMGEEFADEGADGDEVWVIDPIDGTKQFSAGLPLYSTLIAFARARRPLVGVMEFPATRERWSGAEGNPSRLNGREISVRDCSSLDRAWIACGNPTRGTRAECAATMDLARAGLSSVWGAGSYGFAVVASGKVDVAPDCGLDPFDFAAMAPVLEGAGGVAVTWSGEPLSLDSGSQVLFLGDRRLLGPATRVLQTAAN